MTEHWYGVKDGDMWVRSMLNRHYSANHYRDGRSVRLSAGPGEKMLLLTTDGAACFIWRKFISKDNQVGVNCAMFRNERPDLYKASDLILEAEQLAWQRWPGERLYTYVNPRKIRKTRQPGRCFLKAGWRYAGHIKYKPDCEDCRSKGRACGTTAIKGLLIVEKLFARLTAREMNDEKD